MLPFTKIVVQISADFFTSLTSTFSKNGRLYLLEHYSKWFNTMYHGPTTNLKNRGSYHDWSWRCEKLWRSIKGPRRKPKTRNMNELELINDENDFRHNPHPWHGNMTSLIKAYLNDGKQHIKCITNWFNENCKLCIERYNHGSSFHKDSHQYFFNKNVDPQRMPLLFCLSKIKDLDHRVLQNAVNTDLQTAQKFP